MNAVNMNFFSYFSFPNTGGASVSPEAHRIFPHKIINVDLLDEKPRKYFLFKEVYHDVSY